MPSIRLLLRYASVLDTLDWLMIGSVLLFTIVFWYCNTGKRSLK